MDREEKVLIIAEAGVNYNGDIELAKKMVKVAAQAGADIVKFQTGIPENVSKEKYCRCGWGRKPIRNGKEINASLECLS